MAAAWSCRADARAGTRTIRLSVILVMLCTLGVPWAAAQFDPDVAVAADADERRLGPGEQAIVTWTVQNAGPLDADAVVTTTAPAGWTIELSQADRGFSLAAGAQQDLTTTVRAPDPGLNVTPADGPWELVVTLTDGLGRSDEAATSVSLAYIAAPVVIEPTPPDNTPLYLSLGAATTLLVLVGLYLWQARLVEVTLEENDLDVMLGSHAIVHARVHNRSRWARNVHVRLSRLPANWGGAFSARFVCVGGHGVERIPMFLRLPFDDAPDRSRVLSIQARPNRFSPWVTRAKLRIQATVVRVPMLVRAATASRSNGNSKGPAPEAVVPKASA